MRRFELEAQSIADSYSPHGVGRCPRLANANTVRTFLDAVAAGNYLQTAASIAGLSKQTVHNWLKRGEQGEVPYDLFLDAYKKATASAEAAAVDAVRQAGSANPRYWAASMTSLERRFPERWARRRDVDGGPKIIVQIGADPRDVRVRPTEDEDTHSSK